MAEVARERVRKMAASFLEEANRVSRVEKRENRLPSWNGADEEMLQQMAASGRVRAATRLEASNTEWRRSETGDAAPEEQAAKDPVPPATDEDGNCIPEPAEQGEKRSEPHVMASIPAEAPNNSTGLATGTVRNFAASFLQEAERVSNRERSGNASIERDAGMLRSLQEARIVSQIVNSGSIVARCPRGPQDACTREDEFPAEERGRSDISSFDSDRSNDGESDSEDETPTEEYGSSDISSSDWDSSNDDECDCLRSEAETTSTAVILNAAVNAPLLAHETSSICIDNIDLTMVSAVNNASAYYPRHLFSGFCREAEMISTAIISNPTPNAPLFAQETSLISNDNIHSIVVFEVRNASDDYRSFSREAETTSTAVISNPTVNAPLLAQETSLICIDNIHSIIVLAAGNASDDYRVFRREAETTSTAVISNPTVNARFLTLKTSFTCIDNVDSIIVSAVNNASDDYPSFSREAETTSTAIISNHTVNAPLLAQETSSICIDNIDLSTASAVNDASADYRSFSREAETTSTAVISNHIVKAHLLAHETSLIGIDNIHFVMIIAVRNASDDYRSFRREAETTSTAVISNHIVKAPLLAQETSSIFIDNIDLSTASAVNDASDDYRSFSREAETTSTAVISNHIVKAHLLAHETSLIGIDNIHFVMILAVRNASDDYRSFRREAETTSTAVISNLTVNAPNLALETSLMCIDNIVLKIVLAVNNASDDYPSYSREAETTSTAIISNPTLNASLLAQETSLICIDNIDLTTVSAVNNASAYYPSFSREAETTFTANVSNPTVNSSLIAQETSLICIDNVDSKIVTVANKESDDFPNIDHPPRTTLAEESPAERCREPLWRIEIMPGPSDGPQLTFYHPAEDLRLPEEERCTRNPQVTFCQPEEASRLAKEKQIPAPSPAGQPFVSTCFIQLKPPKPRRINLVPYVPPTKEPITPDQHTRGGKVAKLVGFFESLST